LATPQLDVLDAEQLFVAPEHAFWVPQLFAVVHAFDVEQPFGPGELVVQLLVVLQALLLHVLSFAPQAPGGTSARAIC
jgi:hypothetical protein